MDKSEVKSNLKWFNVICTIIAEIWKALSTQHPLRRWLFLKDQIYFIHYGSVCDYFIWVPVTVAVLLTYGMGHGAAKVSGLWKQMVCYDTADVNYAMKPKVTQHWIWCELLLLVATLAQLDNKGTWKLNCCLAAFKEEMGIPELSLLSGYSRHTQRGQIIQLLWISYHSVLERCLGLDLFSVCHLVVMLSMSALTLDSP